ncbi:uncharacterized protein LOC133197655 [Saccostrea echinata]|uniref:uncharacterized protein LOC133197655 n=1 Tax=Saccostrea echinata TaxID=191078 RepID=UPI002A82C9D8|nr:uncharacterized protein LOC133197655 [Saccostrea echinata]
MKPLLSIPGNNSNILEVWETNSSGKFHGIFLENIMRNPAIDWWKDRRLYHIPEYVKLLTMNKHGQWLWSMDFFTNGSTADMKSWMNASNILSNEYKNSVSGISLGQDILAIHNGRHSVCFLHGDILKDGSGSRVTVFTLNKQPQPVFASMPWGIFRIMENVDNDNSCRTKCAALAGFIFKNDAQQQITVNCTIFDILEKSLVIADRVVILGYYHKEEPKVSKWEFLNNFTYEEIQNIMRPVLENTKTEGTVPVRNLSSSVRKKESAPDHRKSSQGIGILGGFLLGFTFILIFISDVMILKVHLGAMYQNLFRLFKVEKKKSSVEIKAQQQQ